MQLFYTDAINGNSAVLSEDETRHCVVLRKTAGDEIMICNGKGHLFRSLITGMSGKQIQLQILETMSMQPLRNYHLHLYIAPTKQNERMEWMLEKAIEAGLDEITFIECAHSEKSRINMGRLHKIAVSAMKQSGQLQLPIINPLTPLGELTLNGVVLLAHCREDSGKLSFNDAVSKHSASESFSVLIGPEGDFSESEVQMLKSKGAIAIALGNSRLRTETAGLYCAIALNALH